MQLYAVLQIILTTTSTGTGPNETWSVTTSYFQSKHVFILA